MRQEALVYINTKECYYARWIIRSRTRHVGYVSDEAMSPEWIETLRTHPEYINTE